jgi:hypothetical protein
MKKLIVLFLICINVATVDAETFFIRTNSDVTSWNNIPDVQGTKITLDFGDNFSNYAYVGDRKSVG